MGSYTCFSINGHRLLDIKNSAYGRFFGRPDRVVEIEEDLDEQTGQVVKTTRFLYKVSARTLKRRMALQGITYDALAADFAISMKRQCEIARKHKAERGAKTHAHLLSEASLDEWLSALKALLEGSAPSASLHGIIEILNGNEPDYMKEEEDNIDEEAEFPKFYWGIKWPTLKFDFAVRAVLEVVPDTASCSLDMSDFVEAGYTDDFDDLERLTEDDITEPKKVFDGAVSEIRALLPLCRANAILTKLLYANVITAFETYMGDTAKRCILGRNSLLRRFVETNPKLQEDKFSMSDIFSKYEKVEATVTQMLDDITFHNMKVTVSLYKNILGIEIPENVRSTLGKAILRRHDIVHRNGKDVHGKSIKISVKEIRELLSAAEKAISEVDRQIRESLLHEQSDYS